MRKTIDITTQREFCNCVLIASLAFLLTCCAPASNNKALDPTTPSFNQIVAKPLPPEQAEEMLDQVGQNWLYGQGVGDTAVVIGSTVAFPPIGLWWLGNAIASLSGYEPLRVSDALPGESGKIWEKSYDTATSGPGRIAAAVAGKEYRIQELAKESLKKYIPSDIQPSSDSNLPESTNLKARP